MFLVFLIKNMCLLAFYFAFATLVFVQPVHKSMILVYFVILICMSISYAINKRNESNKIKYLPILGVVLTAFYLNTLTGMFAILFPVVYMFFVIKNNDFYIEYNTFKDLFVKLIMAIVILVLIVFIISWFELFKSISVQYVIVFLISGVYLMRTARHTKEIISSKIFSSMNILVVVGASIVCIVLSSPTVLNAIIYVIKLMYNKIFVPSLLGVTYAIMWILKAIMSFIFMFIKVKNIDMEAQESEMAEEVEKIVESIDYSSNQIVIKIISYTLVIILLLFLLKKFLSSKNKKIIGEAEGVSQQRSSLDGDFRKNKKNKRGFGNSLSQIRYWYKKYLVLCYRKNMDVSMSDSSQTILDKSTDIFIDNKNDLEEIRDIYRKARYSSFTIHSQDVKKFKSIYKKLENEKNKSK